MNHQPTPTALHLDHIGSISGAPKFDWWLVEVMTKELRPLIESAIARDKELFPVRDTTAVYESCYGAGVRSMRMV